MENKNLDLMTVGGGCFWSIDAIFNEIEGVVKVVSGYSGGNVPGKPTYREVCSGRTGHTEVVQITFNAAIISYQELLMIFMTSHNPTILNPKILGYGSQYKSVIFYHSAAQKKMAEKLIKEIMPLFEHPVTTIVSKILNFFPAEMYHQQYYKNNPQASYCSVMIRPKIMKLRELYIDKLKKNVP